MTVETYLRTSFEDLDREYVGGQLVERGSPTYPHARAQARTAALLFGLSRQHAIFPAISVRLALVPQRHYRIADVSVFRGCEPVELFPSTPPFIAIEIASPDDRLTEALKKFSEYHHWGVEHIWLIDPVEKQFYIYDAAGLRPVETLDLPQYAFSISLTDLQLDFRSQPLGNLESSS